MGGSNRKHSIAFFSPANGNFKSKDKTKYNLSSSSVVVEYSRLHRIFASDKRWKFKQQFARKFSDAISQPLMFYHDSVEMNPTSRGNASNLKLYDGTTTWRSGVPNSFLFNVEHIKWIKNALVGLCKFRGRRLRIRHTGMRSCSWCGCGCCRCCCWCCCSCYFWSCVCATGENFTLPLISFSLSSSARPSWPSCSPSSSLASPASSRSFQHSISFPLSLLSCAPQQHSTFPLPIALRQQCAFVCVCVYISHRIYFVSP